MGHDTKVNFQMILLTEKGPITTVMEQSVIRSNGQTVNLQGMNNGIYPGSTK
jgi:hypothetical protein